MRFVPSNKNYLEVPVPHGNKSFLIVGSIVRSISNDRSNDQKRFGTYQYLEVLFIRPEQISIQNMTIKLNNRFLRQRICGCLS